MSEEARTTSVHRKRARTLALLWQNWILPLYSAIRAGEFEYYQDTHFKHFI
ncbi:MAG: hypothetical protein KME64_36565 [Scytonematopsis contorta HA4267-MV1]|nr:hypothetical protein [Scytonematopsis contorta HA4267-MV1]